MTSLAFLGYAQVDQASIVLSKVFECEPVYAFFFPDELRRQNVLRYHFALRLRDGISRGEVLSTSSGLEGISIWLPPGRHGLALPTMIAKGGLSVLVQMGLRSAIRQMSVNRYLQSEQAANANFPHWYLSALGVDQQHRGRGYASAMLRPMLARLDTDGSPCYLDTQKEANIAVYRRFGFGVVSESRIPGTSIKTWAMLRKPFRPTAKP